MFSDEAHFGLNGYVNKQNYSNWRYDNCCPILITFNKNKVWCGLWASGIIGSYVFKNSDGQTVIVNGDLYRDMITNFFVPQLEGINVADMWFQQDGTTYHTARYTINLMQATFGQRLILRNRPVNWPPRSCDLMPSDYLFS